MPARCSQGEFGTGSSKRPVTPACPRSLKFHGRIIWSQRSVNRQERPAFLPDLGNQNAIERIGMVQREIGNLQRVARRDRQLPPADFCKPGPQGDRIHLEFRPPEPRLGDNLPEACSQKVGMLPFIRQPRMCGLAQSLGGVGCPKHQMRVCQKLTDRTPWRFPRFPCDQNRPAQPPCRSGIRGGAGPRARSARPSRGVSRPSQ